MNEVTKHQPAQVHNPFARTDLPAHVNAGTIAIESERAIAEAQGKLVIAKRFPRDPFSAFQRSIEACKRKGLAEEAIYSYPRGGQTVSGPSIRLAEELARCWGNIDYGYRELSQRDGVSEMEAYAWDLETNTVSSQKFTVRHIRDKREGGQLLTDQRDIYELTANMAARRMRARLLAILPPDMVDAAVAQCRDTMAGNSDQPMADRVRDMLAAFAKIGVTLAMVELRLGHKVAEILPEEFADMKGIYKSLRDGMTKAADWFAGAAQPQASPEVEQLNEQVKKRTTKKAAAPQPPAPTAGDAAASPPAGSDAPQQPAGGQTPTDPKPRPVVTVKGARLFETKGDPALGTEFEHLGIKYRVVETSDTQVVADVVPAAAAAATDTATDPQNGAATAGTGAANPTPTGGKDLF